MEVLFEENKRHRYLEAYHVTTRSALLREVRLGPYRANKIAQVRADILILQVL